MTVDSDKSHNTNNKWISTIHSILSLISYFDFVGLHKYGNHFLASKCREDLVQIRKGIEEKKLIDRPWRTQDEIVLGRIEEADIKDFIKLFDLKYQEAVANRGFKTQKVFAQKELQSRRALWGNHNLEEWFPIATQWLLFLQEVASEEHSDLNVKVEADSSEKEIIRKNLHYLTVVDPPVIDKKGRFLLGSRKKSAISVFVRVLRKRGLLSHDLNSQELVEVLNELIPGLSLGADGKTLRDPANSMVKLYNEQLLNLIAPR